MLQLSIMIFPYQDYCGLKPLCLLLAHWPGWTPWLGDMGSGRGRAGASPAELLASWGLGAPLPPAGHRQGGGATLALHLNRLWARVAAACQNKPATPSLVRSQMCG